MQTCTRAKSRFCKFSDRLHGDNISPKNLFRNVMRRYSLFVFVASILISSSVAAVESTLCTGLVQEVIAKEIGKLTKVKPSVRELCFPSDQSCADNGGLSAHSIWENAHDPMAIKNALVEYSGWSGLVSEATLSAARGKIVRIERFVGSAHCVRDTYLILQDDRYRLLHSASLEKLSDEAGNCGDAEISLRQIGDPLLVTMLYGEVTAYRFDQNFELSPVCSIRYRAPHSQKQ